MAASHRFVVSLLAAILTAAPAMAQQVGTATAVNPLSESTPPGGATGPLQVGAHIVHNEKIHTTPNGTAQLLFTDKSSLSIAPNTSIVIDDYVYDPNAQSGHMLVSLAKGALRFVGGQLSHQGEALITTSAATIGIRGGTVTVIHGPNGTEVIDHFGIITIHNEAGTFVLRRSDFKVLIPNAHVLPSEAIRVGGDETAYYQQYIMSKRGEYGGVLGLKAANLGHCVIGLVSSANCPQTPWMPTDGGELDAFQLLNNANHFGTGQITPPPPPPPPTPPPPPPPPPPRPPRR
jgi:hypothetical protein